MMKTQHCVVAGFAALSFCMATSADWRSELRARMSPNADVRDVLDQRGTVIDDMIGDRAVELTWSGSSLSLKVDSSPIADLHEYVVNDGSVVVVFEAYEGRGALGTTDNYGLEGWVYLDDFGRVRLDLRVPSYAALFQLDANGHIAVPPHGLKCRCSNTTVTTCTEEACDGEYHCPNGPSSAKCGYFSESVAQFENGFESVTVD